jgi:hypothetical protein
MFEVSSDALARGGYLTNASWQSLVEHGYEMYRLEGGRLVRLMEVEDGNLFAVHPRSEWPARLSDDGINVTTGGTRFAASAIESDVHL